MKRLFYVSRFSRPLAKHDIDAIRESAIRYNRLHRVTGILVCLGDMLVIDACYEYTIDCHLICRQSSTQIMGTSVTREAYHQGSNKGS